MKSLKTISGFLFLMVLVFAGAKKVYADYPATFGGNAIFDITVYKGNLAGTIVGQKVDCTTANGCYGVLGYIASSSSASANVPVYPDVGMSSFSWMCPNFTGSVLGMALSRTNLVCGYGAYYIAADKSGGATIPLYKASGNPSGMTIIDQGAGIHGYVYPGSYSCPSGGILSGTTCLTPVNASCGTAQRTFAYSESSWVTYSACTMGSGSLPAFPAQGSSASWTCSGLNGGTNAPCTATRQVAPVNGACGLANGTTGATQPTSGFCTAGSYSGISGTGPWNWSCIGSGGGTTAACSANKSTPVNGVCTTPPNGSSYATLLAGSCTQGTYANFTGSGPWSWQCLGSSGGSDANCSATLLVVNGSCGPISGTSSKTAPTSGFCNGGTFSGLAGTGPWTWSCTGSGGGTTANTCFQDKSLDGVCGTDNTKTFANYPSANACSVGSPTLKTQDATSWTWNCSGVGTGAIASSDCIGFKAPATGASGWREVAP